MSSPITTGTGLTDWVRDEQMRHPRGVRRVSNSPWRWTRPVGPAAARLRRLEAAALTPIEIGSWQSDRTRTVGGPARAVAVPPVRVRSGLGTSSGTSQQSQVGIQGPMIGS